MQIEPGWNDEPTKPTTRKLTRSQYYMELHQISVALFVWEWLEYEAGLLDTPPKLASREAIEQTVRRGLRKLSRDSRLVAYARE